MTRSLFALASLSIVGLALLSLAACSGGGGGGNTAPAPHITVSTTALPFGNLVLNNYVDQSVQVQNTGSASLSIGLIVQAIPLSLPFSIVSDSCSGRQIGPSETCTVQVRFLPTTQGTFAGAYDIPSSDVTNNPVTVTVSGAGEALRASLNQVSVSSCPNIDLLMSVTDRVGTAIGGLGLANFALTEGGVPQTIVSVTQIVTPGPVSVALLMDNSNSMTPNLANIQSASVTFVGQLGNSDQAEIVKFAFDDQVMQAFTSDQALLNTAIIAPYTGSKNGTRLYDALWNAIDDVAATLPVTNVRALVVISNGVDETGQGVPNASTHSLADVITHANANGAVIFTIGFDGVNAGVMNRLAGQTGGQYFFTPNSVQLTAIYQAIRHILDGQYTVQYRSSSGGSRSTSLGVFVESGGNQGVVSRLVTGCP